MRLSIGISEIVSGDKVPHVGSSSADDFSFTLQFASTEAAASYPLYFLRPSLPTSFLSHVSPFPPSRELFPLSLSGWLDFLLNSFGKKLRCRNGDSLFSHSLIPRDNPRAASTATRIPPWQAGFHLIPCRMCTCDWLTKRLLGNQVATM